MDMPKVVICQERRLSRRFLKENGISDELAGYIELILANPRQMKVDEELEEQYRELMKRLPTGDVRKDVFFDGGPDCPSLLSRCINDGLEFNCCQQAKVKFDRKDGKCFLLDNVEPQTWPNLGLEVEAKLNPDAYFSSAAESQTIGLIVKIQSKYDPIEGGGGIRIPPGYKAMLEIEKMVMKLVNGGFGDKQCEPSLAKNTPSSWCSAKCRMATVIRLYNCTRPVEVSFLDDGKLVPVCSPKDLRHSFENRDQVCPGCL